MHALEGHRFGIRRRPVSGPLGSDLPVVLQLHSSPRVEFQL